MKNKIPFALALIGFTALLGCGAQAPQESIMFQNPPAHHNPNGTFKNTDSLFKKPGFSEVVKWWWNRKTPDPIAFEVVKPDLSPWTQNENSGIHALWIGHSTFLLRIHGVTVLTDPIFSERASPVQWAGPKRSTPAALKIEELPAVDVVILSHDHYDHTDINSLRALAKLKSSTGKPPVFLTPLGFKKWFEKNDLPPSIDKDWWESEVVAGLKFTPAPVQHWGKRSVGDDNTRLWCAWVIESNGKKIYFGGDTGYSNDFIQTHKRFGAMDLALIPIGAYNPEWFMQPQHVNPEQAVQIHQDLEAKQSIGMHWGTFQLTDEPMDEPPVRLQKALIQKNLSSQSFIALYHGALWSEGAALPKTYPLKSTLSKPTSAQEVQQ